jgi:DNA primase
MNHGMLRDGVDFGAVLTHYGINMNGRVQAVVKCPIHDEQNPSCSINMTKGTYNCFSGCGGGDSISLVMAMEELEDPTLARQWLEASGFAEEVDRSARRMLRSGDRRKPQRREGRSSGRTLQRRR